MTVDQQIASGVVWALWGASMLTRVAALAALAHRRLLTRFPVLTVALFVWTVRSGYLLHSYLRGGNGGVERGWIASQPVVIALDCALVFGCFLLMVRHSGGRFWKFGTVAMSVFIAVSALIVSVAAGVLDVPDTAAPAMVAVTRNYLIGCLLVLWMSYALFRAADISLSANLHQHVRALTILFGGAIVAQQLHIDDGFWGVFVAQLAILGSAIWAHMIWWLRIQRGGEIAPPPLPPEVPSDETPSGLVARAKRGLEEALKDRWRLRFVW